MGNAIREYVVKGLWYLIAVFYIIYNGVNVLSFPYGISVRFLNLLARRVAILKVVL